MITPVAGQQDPANKKLVKSLLLPIVSLLSEIGIVEEDLIKIVSSLYLKKTKDKKKLRSVEQIGNPMHQYGDMVSLWTRDKRFIDRTGRPRVLSFRGKDSLSSLVRIVNAKEDPKSVVSTFKRYGTVRETKKNSYELLRPYFCMSTIDNFAFGPFVHFLTDASITIGHILKKANQDTDDLGRFWRKVEVQGISRDAEKKFAMFARDRSQAFLEELDEWLLAHSQKGNRKIDRSARRVGLGLFSISSDLKTK